MKILLVMPPRDFTKEAPGLISIPPLGVAHIASYVKQHGYDIKLDDLDIKIISNRLLFNQLLELQNKYGQKDLDEYLLNNKKNQYLETITNLLISELDYKGHNVIGFSLIESSAIDSMLLIAKRLKELNNPFVVVGGESASLELQKKYPFINRVILGKGELPFLNILKKIDGLVNNESNIIPLDFPHPIPDFTGIPVNNYKLLPKEGSFYNPGRLLILPYIWSEGCPFKCSYCGSSANNNYTKPPHRTPKETADQLEELSKKYNTGNFFILNSYIHINREHTIELCNELIKRNMNLMWCGSARCTIDNSLLPLLFKAGLFYISYGLESASDKILKNMRKGYTAEIAERTIRATHNTGIWSAIYIIVGFPHETEKDFRKTFDFIDRNHEYIDQMSVCPFYLVNSAVLLNPDKFGIKIRDKIGSHKHLTSPEFAYDEINGLKWEELKVVKQKRVNMLYRLFFGIHKKIPERIYRAGTYQVFHAFSKYKDKRKIYSYLLDHYRKELNKTDRIIAINKECNNNCECCKMQDEIQSMDNIREDVVNMRKEGVNRIIISGGEPTIDKHLFRIIRIIREQGLDITLRTNARTLYYLDFCKKLYDSGVRRISVPVYSNKPELHDKVTKVKGSFNQTIEGIDNWKRLGGEVEIRTALHDINKDNMYDFVRFILNTETHHIM